jgi:L-malate glycosyltransferase
MFAKRPRTDGRPGLCSRRHRPPRVLQVVLSLDSGGTERLVIDIVKRLHAEIPMAVCCLDDEGRWAAQLKAEQIRVTALARQSGFTPSLGHAVARAATQHDAGIIHCHHYSPFVYSCIARFWQPGTRVIFTEHGRLSDVAPSPKRRLANRILARIPDGVFAVSEDLKRHLVAEGFSTTAVRVIHNGIAIGPPPTTDRRSNARRSLGVPEGTLVIATVGRLDPVKDVGVLIRAMPALAREIPVMLMIIGDGRERTSLECLAEACGVTRHVRFFGHRDDARDLLIGCDVYVNSSISEGVSLTILEAMAAGLPIVATNVGGTPEVVDAASGRLIPKRDSGTLSRTLLELAAQPMLREALGRAARLRVEARFSLERMVREYRDAYNEAA